MLTVGAPAPDFTLLNKENEEVRFYDILEKGPVVLYFYPKNETLGCTKEACAFRDAYEDFKEAGAEVVGVSADSTSSHLKFASKRRLPFILLSDPKLVAHKQYDASPSLFGIFRSRITYVIGQDKTIRHAFSSQLNISGHITESLKTISQL